MLRRALRHVFTTLAALSLLLCVAVGVLWVRSYWLQDSGAVSVAQRSWFLDSHCGDVRFFVIGPPTPYELESPRWTTWRRDDHRGTWEHDPFTYHSEFGGIGFDSNRYSGEILGIRWFRLKVPHAYFTLATLVIGVPRFVTMGRAARRRRRGFRRACGYDLRATPERCPECGTEVSRVTPAA